MGKLPNKFYSVAFLIKIYKSDFFLIKWLQNPGWIIDTNPTVES